jgi:eukaryotic-like serine/threonine-protein kinase
VLREQSESKALAHLTMLSTLGAGGFGVVYEAVDTRTGGRVAVKELDRTTPEAIVRFKQEFRAIADLHHPNLVGLKELIEHNGRWLIVMELVPGTDFLSASCPCSSGSLATSS